MKTPSYSCIQRALVLAKPAQITAASELTESDTVALFTLSRSPRIQEYLAENCHMESCKTLVALNESCT